MTTTDLTRHELAEVRRYAIKQMWREGATMREIAEELGTTVGTVQVEIANLRSQGVSIEYRLFGYRINRRKT